MAATVTSLAARALRKLGVVVVANADRQPESATLTQDDLAAAVLRNLDIPVPEASRPGMLGTVSQAEVASRALRSLGVNLLGASGSSTGVTYSRSALAVEVLEKLTVISPEGSALGDIATAADLSEATQRLTAVHDQLTQMGYATWGADAIPASVSEQYIIMSANLQASAFGKQGSAESFGNAMEQIAEMALSGAYGQSLAEAKVQAVHDSLNATGLVSWPISAIPIAFAEDYVQITTAYLAPTMRKGGPEAAQDRDMDAKLAPTATERIRIAANVQNAQARALTKVQAAHAELNDMGVVTWPLSAVPASMSESYIGMATASMLAASGSPVDPKLWTVNYEKIRAIAMRGPAGQALAEQELRSVHADLDARGKTRWSIFDIPPHAEEPYVLMTAYALGPQFPDARVDPNWRRMGEMMINQVIALQTTDEPVRATYF